MANEYPTVAFGGPRPLKYFKRAKDYGKVTVVNEYEDGGASFNSSAADVPQEWMLFYDGLTEAQAAVLDAHYNLNQMATGFPFQEPRNEPFTTTGTTYTDVHYAEYERPEHNKYTVQSRRVKLIKRPV